jgi:glycosyltransferase involved in cell wall biosynthesis
MEERQSTPAAAPETHKLSPPIGYFTQVYPDLTQTFVYREVLALREQNVNVRTFSVWRPEVDDLPPEARPLMDETFYVFPLPWISTLLAHLCYLFSRPLRYFGALVFVLTRPGESLKNRIRSLIHFVYGMLVVREMDRAQIQHIHVHFAWSASSIALIAHRILGTPFSMTLHSNEIYFDRLLLQAKLQDARFVVTISTYNRRLIEQLWPNAKQKTHVVHCGLDPDLFSPAAGPQVETLSPSRNGEFTMVGVGQLAPRKGFHILIEACRQLVDQHVAFRCHIFGEGPERGRLEALVEQYALGDKVKLPGRIHQQELRQILNQADVFVLPCIKDKSGDQDGIPVVLMEAMAMELATVSTRISGIPELIEHKVNGMLAPPDDADALAEILQGLARDPGERTRLGKAGRETVVNEFNIHRSAQKMATLLRGQLG